jgi:hypothetical protein
VPFKCSIPKNDLVILVCVKIESVLLANIRSINISTTQREEYTLESARRFSLYGTRGQETEKGPDGTLRVIESFPITKRYDECEALSQTHNKLGRRSLALATYHLETNKERAFQNREEQPTIAHTKYRNGLPLKPEMVRWILQNLQFFF